MNKDGKVSVEEAKAVDSINVDSKGITSLKGIEYFPALKSLSCNKNKLTDLDVSKNPALRNLCCDKNPNLSALWFRTNQELKKFIFDKDSSIIKYKQIFIRQL